MRQIQRHALALIAGALTSSMAVAQQPPRQGPPPRAPQAGAPQAGAPAGARRQMAPGESRPGGRGPGAEGRRSGPGGSPAAMLLRLRTQLELTDDQVKRLEALAAAPRPSLNQAEMLRARADMMDASKGDGDLAKTRAALDKMSRLRNDAVLAQMKVRQDVRGVLTAAQKTTLDNMRGEMRGRARGAARDRMRRGDDVGAWRGLNRAGPQGGPPAMGPGARGRRGFEQEIDGNVEREVIIERRRTPPPVIDSLPPQ